MIEIPLPSGGVLHAVLAMECVCVHCKQVITPASGKFYVLDAPYHACLHPNCLPFYEYPPSWPHAKPAVCYGKY